MTAHCTALPFHQNYFLKCISIRICDFVNISVDHSNHLERKWRIAHSRTVRVRDREIKRDCWLWPCSRILRGYISVSRSTRTLPRSSTLWIVPERTVCFPVYGTCLPCFVLLPHAGPLASAWRTRNSRGG